MISCDCCGEKIREEEKCHKVPLPYRYRYKNTLPTANGYIHGNGLPTAVETKMKDYDFCDDCFNAFGEMMWMCDDEATTLQFDNFLFPSIAYTAKHIIDKENENVD